ncbi:MAG: ComEC/Rec2 family competence protein [Coleofasciculaceae cyanobacterium]
MNSASGVLLSLAYILGLLSAASFGLPKGTFPDLVSVVSVAGACLIGTICAFTLPRLWRTGPRRKLWLATGIVAALAILYFQARIPQPTAENISQFVTSANSSDQAQVVTVQGKVDSMVHLTRSGKGQFWFRASQLNELESRDNQGAVSKGVTGKLYVTVPLLQSTGLYPGQKISVTGILYKPKPATNPGAFDFRSYLTSRGTFAGLSGLQVNFPEIDQEKPWGWWKVRQRIIRSQTYWLGSPKGQLISSIVLGRRAVDLPYDIRDQFIEAGLAHVLAASGFHISLILGLVLTLTRRWGIRTQFGVGLSALIIYICLTGLQPSVLRAGIMGFGALIALVTQRKTKPLGSLLVAATILLVWNPLWIKDLGFQLSFLATLGLLVTVPTLTKCLDRLPTVIASLIAVPLAASLWTLPLQLYIFHQVVPYSLAANIICSPLIALISLGGVISALAAIVSPVAGSALAWLLYYPIHLLLKLVQFFQDLPGSSVAIGKISVVQLLLLYGLIGITCINKRWQSRWWLPGLLAANLVVLPAWQTKTSLFQATVLATSQEQVLVIQDQGTITLVNSGETDTVNFAVLPFLRQQGVNQIDWAIALDSRPRFRSGWESLLNTLPVKTFFDQAALQSSSKRVQTPSITGSSNQIASTVKAKQGNYQLLSTDQPITIGSVSLETINAAPSVSQLQLRDKKWLLLGEVSQDFQKQLVTSLKLPPVQVLLWSGNNLDPKLLEVLAPKVAIASASTIDPDTAKLLEDAEIELYWTGRDGAIQWTPKSGFETTLETVDNDSSLL